MRQLPLSRLPPATTNPPFGRINQSRKTGRSVCRGDPNNFVADIASMMAHIYKPIDLVSSSDEELPVTLGASSTLPASSIVIE